MKKILMWFLGIGMIFALSTPLAWAGHLDKDLGVDWPDRILSGGEDFNGASGAITGDIDGNGKTDLIMIWGTPVNGIKYVGVFFDATLSSLKGLTLPEADFVIVTEKEWDFSVDHPTKGLAVGDFNSDGYDDILFGLPRTKEGEERDERGEAYIVLGNTPEGLGALRDFAVDPPDFTFFGVDQGGEDQLMDQGDWAGFSVASGDVNGDGRSDVIIGAPGGDGPNNEWIDVGEVYVMTHIDWSQSSMVLTRSNVDLYLYGDGETGQKYGYAVTVGNLNGDVDEETGYPIEDIIVSPKAGSLKMIFGKNSEQSLSFADWESGYTMIGRSPCIVTVDLDRDGIADLVSGEGGGNTFITYGSVDTILPQADATVRNTVHDNDMLGFSNAVSDFDGDGFKDLLILAPNTHGKNNQFSMFVGEAHIVWGRPTRFSGVIDLKYEPRHFTFYGSDGTGSTELASNFLGPSNSRGGYVFGMELGGRKGGAELFFGEPHHTTYIYKIGPRPAHGKGHRRFKIE